MPQIFNPRKIFKWLAVGVLAVLLLVAGLLGFLQTGMGRNLLSAKLSSLLSSGPDQQVRVGSIHGFPPMHLTVGDIDVSDRRGVWLNIHELVLRWSPLALLKGKIEIVELSARQVSVERLPRGAAEQSARPETPGTALQLPETVPPVRIADLHISTLQLKQAVVGRAAAFGLRGKIVKTQGQDGLRANLELHRLDAGPSTRLNAALVLQGRPMQLGVSAAFREAPEGWVAHILGLQAKGPLRIAVDGNGPLDHWQGVVDCGAGRWGALHTSLDLHYSREIRLVLQSKYTPGPQLIPPAWHALLGSQATLDLHVRMVPSRSLRVDKLQVQGAGYQLQAAADVDLQAETVHGRFQCSIKDLQVAEGAVKMPVGGRLTLQGSVFGPWRQPRGTLSLELRNLKTPSLTARAVETKVQLEPTGTLAPHFGGVRLSGSGQVRGMRLPSGRELPEKDLQWSLQARLSPRRKLALSRFAIVGEHQSLQLTGHFDPAQSQGELTAILNVSDLRGLSGFLGKPVAGTASFKVHVAALGGGSSAKGRIEGFVRPAATAAGSSSVFSLLTPELKFGADLNLRQGTRLTVSDLHAASKTFQLSSKVQMDFKAKTLQGDWQLALADLRPLSAVVGKSLAGSLRADGTVRGPFDRLDVAAQLQGNRVHFDTLDVDKVLLSLDSTKVPAAPEGSLRLELLKQKAKLLFATRFFKDQQRVGLSGLHLQAPGADLRGDLKFDLRSTLLEGKVTGRLRDLSALGRFTGQDLRGSGDLRARFRAVRGGQDIELHLKGRSVSTPFAKLDRLQLAANLKDLLRKPRGSADLELRGLENGSAKIATLTFRATGDEQGMHFESRLRGQVGSALELRMRGVAAHTKASDRLRLEMLRGRLGDFPVKLLRTVTVERSAAGFSLDGLAMSFGGGQLQASGRLAAPRVKADLTVRNWPLQAAALFGGPQLQGTARGRLQVSGATDRPELQLQLHVTDLRSTDSSLQGIPPATVTAQARLQHNRLRLQSTLQGPFEQPARLELQIPLTVSLVPVAVSLPADGALRGHFSAGLDLFNVSKMLLWDDQELSGKAVADLNIGGRLKAPQVSGNVTVSHAGYVNYVSGTVLKNLNVTIQAQGPRLEISRLQATDGGKGKISGSGRLELDATRHFPMDLKVSLDHATLVRRDEVTGTATGAVQVSGSLQQLAVTGKLDVTPVEVQIPKRLPAEMTELDVIEIHRGQKAPATARKTAAPAAPPVQMRLDLAVDLPQRIFVRGRGLDSEWKGKLRVTGTAQQPVITGKISVVRGRFNFLNRRFKLTTGTITFYGGSPPSPNLNITAESAVTDMTAQLTVSGPVSDPKLELQSTPALASDEILARLLFRRSTAELTPTQALKLARALQQLTGKGGGGLNLMDRTRKFFGLDELDFQGSEEGFGKGTVGVGKYLSDNVYLNLQKGIGENTDKASVEVEITPNISVESELQSDTSSGIGINWKYDY